MTRPGKILKDATGEVYLIDWDEITLAPRGARSPGST